MVPARGEGGCTDGGEGLTGQHAAARRIKLSARRIRNIPTGVHTFACTGRPHEDA